jgi:hypothetical protein
MHEIGKSSSVIDPFHYIKDMTKSQLEEFKGSEGQFSRLLLMKYDYLDR